jgi:hypothetical protein
MIGQLTPRQRCGFLVNLQHSICLRRIDREEKPSSALGLVCIINRRER